jgi:hypothetical protein
MPATKDGSEADARYLERVVEDRIALGLRALLAAS